MGSVIKQIVKATERELIKKEGRTRHEEHRTWSMLRYSGWHGKTESRKGKLGGGGLGQVTEAGKVIPIPHPVLKG